MAKGKFKEIEATTPEVEDQETEATKANALLITVDLANALVEHLSKDTFSVVDRLINGIRQSRAVTVTDEAKKEE